MKILHLARTKVLHEDELGDASGTVVWLEYALGDRYATLRGGCSLQLPIPFMIPLADRVSANFRHHAQDLDGHFDRFCYGLVRHLPLDTSDI